MDFAWLYRCSDFLDTTGTYILDLWRNCCAALHVHIEPHDSMDLKLPCSTAHFVFYFWFLIAHMHCAEVCDLQICLLSAPFSAAEQCKLNSPLN